MRKLDRRVLSLIPLALAGVLVAGLTLGVRTSAFPGGEVHGYVSARCPNQERDLIRLPDIRVFLEDTGTGARGPAGVTDAHGGFVLSRQSIGSYRLCVEAPGFVAECGVAPVALTGEILYPEADLRIAPQRDGVQGTVLQADSLPCYHENQTFNTSAITTVWLEAGGSTVAGPVKANSLGRYVLPKVPGLGHYTLKAKCLASAAEREVDLDERDLGGGRPVDLTLPNRSPVVVSTVAVAGKKPVRNAAPGAAISANTNAVDPDGDRLHYRWTDGTSRFVSADAPVVRWRLPGKAGSNLLFVEVSDGKGGFANATLPLQTGPTGTRFSGTVLDEVTNAPIPDAQVSVNGASFKTGPEGGFALTVPEAPRYVLNVTTPGYAFLSRIFYSRANDLTLRLQPAHTIPCDPTAQCRILVETHGPAAILTIEPNTLVDKAGRPVTAPFEVDMTVYDLTRTNPLPGDNSATTAGGDDGTLQSYGAVDVTPRDASGNRYTLAPGKTAHLSLPVDRSVLAGGPPPPVIPMWEYDPGSGRWLEEGKGIYDPATKKYETDLTGFSAWNADTVFTNVACIKFTLGTLTARSGPPPLPFILHARIPAAAGTINHNDFLITEEVNGLFRLPPNTQVTLEIRPTSDPTVVLKGITVDSGPPIDAVFQGPPFDGFPPFDYSACNGFDPASTLPGKPVQLTLDLPPHSSPFLSRPGKGDDATSIAYYKAIAGMNVTVDPATHNVTGCSGSAKCNLNGFRTANGLSLDPARPAAGEVVTFYYNNGDLGLGREMHCKTNGAKLACYVTNYGTGTPPIQDVSGAITDTILRRNPIATVAMEYDPAFDTGTDRYGVQFYVYNHATGDQIDTRAVLDGEGLKYSPQICLSCHGGFYDAPANKANGSAFHEFDVFSFKYDRSSSDGGHDFTQANQEQNFRILNGMIRGTRPNDLNTNNPIVKLIDSWYAGCGGVGAPGCTANPAYTVPTGWTGHEKLYRGVVAADCRSCHIARSAGLDWSAFTDLDSYLGTTGSPVCAGSHDMPHGQVPFVHFWLSTNPAEPALLAHPTDGVNLPACR